MTKKKEKKTLSATAKHPPAQDDDDNKNVAITVGANQVPAHLREDAYEYAGAGTSERPEDSVLPYLYIIQKGSPQLNKREPEYMEDAEVGDILNTATRQLYTGDKGIEVVHAFTCRKEVEWIPRTAGGGYVATHEIDTPLLKDVKEVAKADGKGIIRMIGNTGHQLVQTAYHFVIPIETLDVAVVALTSTGLQTSRRWNTIMRSHKIRGPSGPLIAPAFSRTYRLRTVYQTNDAGDWFSYAVDDLDWITEDQMAAYQMAKEFFQKAQAHGVPLGRPPAAQVMGDNTIEGAAADDDAPI